MNDTTCIVWEVHDVVFASSVSTPDDVVQMLTPWPVLVLSLILCCTGYYAVRVASSVAAFAAGTLGAIRLSRLGGQGGNCDHVTLAVLLCGGVAGLLAGSLSKTLSVLSGAAACVAVAGAGFALCGDACSGDMWPNAPRVLSLSVVPFWATMLLTAVGGAVVARKRHREVLAVMAAILGGYGVSVSARALSGHRGAISGVAFLAITVVCAGGGLALQYAVWWARTRRLQSAGSSGRKKKKKKKTVAVVKDADEDADDEYL